MGSFFRLLSRASAKIFSQPAEGILTFIVLKRRFQTDTTTPCRYDQLIREFRHPAMTSVHKLYAVGVNISMQRIIRDLEAYQSQQVKFLVNVKSDDQKTFGLWAPKKCDV